MGTQSQTHPMKGGARGEEDRREALVEKISALMIDRIRTKVWICKKACRAAKIAWLNTCMVFTANGALSGSGTTPQEHIRIWQPPELWFELLCEFAQAHSFGWILQHE